MSAQTSVKIGIGGALGRMGVAVAAVAGAKDGASLTAFFDRPDFAGQTLNGVTLVSMAAAIESCDVIIDFSTPTASVALAAACAAHGGPALVIRAHGPISDAEARRSTRRRQAIPLVRSGNVFARRQPVAGSGPPGGQGDPRPRTGTSKSARRITGARSTLRPEPP